MKLPLHKLRCRFLEFLFTISVNIYRPLFKRKTKAWNLTLADLNQYESGTLGKSLAIFMKHNKFDVQDKLESHDVFHVLTETGTTVPEEISMQYLLWASGKRSVYSLITIGLGTSILPERLTLYLSARKIGQSMVDISAWDLKEMLDQPVSELRSKMYKRRSYSTMNQLLSNSSRL